jgi:tetratricopeptide (TPR) repeat protein
MCASALLLAQPSDAATKAQRAKQAMTEGRFEEAIGLYTELVGLLPANPGMLMNLGLALHSAGRYQQAIDRFRTVVKLQPASTPAWLFLGLAHLKLGQPAEALNPLARVLKWEPHNKVALLERGDALLSLGRATESAAHFRQLAELDPQRAKAWQGLGMSYLALSHRVFETLEKTAPESGYWYVLLARTKAEQEQYRTAFYLYRQALNGGLDLPEIHLALAAIYRKTGHPDWAAVEEARERAAAKMPRAASRPDSPEFYYRQATRYGEQALDAFGRLSQLPPTAEVHELMAYAHRIRGRHRDSINEYEEALRLRPGDRRLQKELARSLWLNQEYDLALPVLQRLVRSEPDVPEVNYLLGDALRQLQRAGEAVPFLEKAVKLSPDFFPAHGSLGRAYMRIGNPDRAAEQLRSALPGDDDGSLRYQLAQVYKKLGKEEAAEQMLAEFQRISKALERKKQLMDEGRQITPP